MNYFFCCGNRKNKIRKSELDFHSKKFPFHERYTNLVWQQQQKLIHSMSILGEMWKIYKCVALEIFIFIFGCTERKICFHFLHICRHLKCSHLYLNRFWLMYVLLAHDVQERNTQFILAFTLASSTFASDAPKIVLL